MAEIGETLPALKLVIPSVIFGSAIATYALILAIKPILKRYALARPNTRSSHVQPTPQGAGIAIIAVTLVTILLLIAIFPSLEPTAIAPVLAAALILAIVGAIDDIRMLEALPRLGVQAMAALIVIFGLPRGLQILPVIPLSLERAALFVALLWFVNLVNFMDGIDWMTVIETITLTAALVLFGSLGALPVNATLIALTLCGAMLGFAPLNRPVARFFLGDVGSLPVGLVLGWLLIQLAANHLAAALLLPLYYVGDATVTLLCRFARGEPVMQAHRSHFYQLALIGGMSVHAIVGRVLSLNVALIALAGATMTTSSLSIHIAAVTTGCSLVGWQLHRFQRGSV